MPKYAINNLQATSFSVSDCACLTVHVVPAILRSTVHRPHIRRDGAVVPYEGEWVLLDLKLIVLSWAAPCATFDGVS